VKAYDNIEYIGEINEHERADFRGNARALLFPVDWQEPFGLVMIETMACGTPVIAFRSGSVQEVIDNGILGFIVKRIDEAVAAVACLNRLGRSKVCAIFERRFTAQRMAQDYLAIYRALPGLRSEAARVRRLNGNKTSGPPLRKPLANLSTQFECRRSSIVGN
jgi:glycosyltransferase involved in cell wall biosynthesis